MDYRRFLGRQEELVLPYLGGATVTASGRGLRVRTSEPLASGWWRFRVKGRDAQPLEPADSELSLLEGLPRLRGHLIAAGGQRVVDDQARIEEVFFPPADEPPPFSPLTARRWHSGELIFELLEFETEAEEAVRVALEEGRSLAEVKGAPASLRAAYAYALASSVAAELGLPLNPLEVRARTRELAEEGRPAAERVLRELDQRRRSYLAARGPRRPSVARAASALLEWNEETERVDIALTSAGAQLLRLRRLAGGQLEVTFRFLGSRFCSLVAAESLRVQDAGVCLDGEDDLVTLESLPGVIREAIDTGQLVVTRTVSDDE